MENPDMDKIDFRKLFLGERSLSTGGTGIAVLLINVLLPRCGLQPLSGDEVAAVSVGLMYAGGMLSKLIKLWLERNK